MAVQNKKLVFLATKTIEKLKISDSSDESVNLVMQNLCLQHKEYIRIPKAELRESVLKILESVNDVFTPSTCVPTSVPISPNEFAEPPVKLVESESSASKAKKRKRGPGMPISLQRDDLNGDEDIDAFRDRFGQVCHTMLLCGYMLKLFSVVATEFESDCTSRYSVK